jgi:hypothetical protein
MQVVLPIYYHCFKKRFPPRAFLTLYSYITNIYALLHVAAIQHIAIIHTYM